MIAVMQATLLVLAGGESRRMGRPKAWLEVGETNLLHWMVERLGPAFSEVVVSFAEPEQLEELAPYRLDVTWLEGLDPDLFRSLNTREDYQRFHDDFPAQG